MNRLFDSNNPVMRALGKLFDIGWLSILFLLFCLPVITIGPATTALYYTSIKVLRRERGYVWAEFWGCFRANFKMATILGLLFTAAYFLLAFNLSATVQGGKGYGGYLFGAYLAMIFVLTCLACYVYPLLSRFDLSFVKLLRLALYMAFRHLPFTIALVAIIAVALAGAYYSIAFNLPFIILVAPAGLSMVYTFPMEHLLKKYMPKSEPIILENGEEVKPWYEE